MPARSAAATWSRMRASSGRDDDRRPGALGAPQGRGDEVDRRLAPPGALDDEHPAALADERLDRLELALAEVGVVAPDEAAQRRRRALGEARVDGRGAVGGRVRHGASNLCAAADTTDRVVHSLGVSATRGRRRRRGRRPRGRTGVRVNRNDARSRCETVPSAAADHAQRLARVVAVEAHPPVVARRGGTATRGRHRAHRGRGARRRRGGLDRGPQCHGPASSRRAAWARRPPTAPDRRLVLGQHVPAGRSSSVRSAGVAVVLAKTTSRHPRPGRRGAPAAPARKPGIDPPCPAERTPSTFHTCQPRPWAPVHGLPGSSTTWCGSSISARVSAGQQPVGLPAEEGRPAREVRHGGPQLPGRRHGPGVVLGLGQQDVGERVHGQPPGGAPGRSRSSCSSSRAARAGPRARRRTSRAVVHLEQPSERGVSRRWSSGSGARRGSAVPTPRDPRASPSRRPGVRSHRAVVSAWTPALWVRSCSIVNVVEGVPGTCAPKRSVRSSRPGVAQPQHGTATKVLVIEPIRYCVSASAGARRRGRRRVPTAPVQTSRRRARAGGDEGSRPSRWAVARTWSRRACRRGVSGIRPP